MPSKDVGHRRITERVSPPKTAGSPSRGKVDYPYGKFPQKGTAPRVTKPVGQMPPKPPGANRKK